MGDYQDLLKGPRASMILLEQLTAQRLFHLPMAVAKKLSNDKNDVMVIGDGAMSAGMAYEAMNNVGALKSKLIVILNDNDMSIAKPVGAMSKYLAKLLSGKLYFSLRENKTYYISFFQKI